MDIPFVQYGVLIFCCLLLGYFSQKIVQLIGYKLTLILGAPGIIAHEISHWIVAKLCGHKILEAKFFAPSTDGSLGYINHAYKRSFTNYITLPMISLAPLFIGPGFYYLITKMHYPELIVRFDIDSGSNFGLQVVLLSMLSIGEWFFDSPSSDKLIWLFVGLSIVTFSVPSSIDIKNCRKQLAILLIISSLLVHYGVNITFVMPYLSFMSVFIMVSLSAILACFSVAWGAHNALKVLHRFIT